MHPIPSPDKFKSLSRVLEELAIEHGHYEQHFSSQDLARYEQLASDTRLMCQQVAAQVEDIYRCFKYQQTINELAESFYAHTGVRQ